MSDDKKDKGYDLWNSKKEHDDYSEDVGWGPLPSHKKKKNSIDDLKKALSGD
jgi:hypothetical protein